MQMLGVSEKPGCATSAVYAGINSYFQGLACFENRIKSINKW